MNYIESQFGNPRGLVGHLVGLIMAYENRSRNQWSLSLLNLQPTDRILEIGFGPGWAIQQASKIAVNGLVAGVDRSETMVKQASIRNRASIKAGRVVLRQGAATKIPFGDAAFDKIYAVNSFHEWNDSASDLQEIKRVLVPNGTLLIVEHPHHHLTEETENTLRQEFRKQLQLAGFESPQMFVNSIRGRAALGIRSAKPF